MTATTDTESDRHEDCLQSLLEKRQREVRDKLSPPWWRIWGRPDPELSKVLGQIHSGLSEISRLVVRRRRKGGEWPYGPEVERQLEAMLLNEAVTKLKISAAWEFSDSLRRMLLLMGDDSYIKAHLLNEQAGSADENPALRWEEFLERHEQDDGSHKGQRKSERLDNLLSLYKDHRVDEPVRALTVEYLSLVYSSRSRAGRLHRAEIDLRDRYLRNLYHTLSVLLPLLSLGTFFASDARNHFRQPSGFGDAFWSFSVAYFNNLHVRYFFIAAFAGAIGGVLTGFIKLRDRIKGMLDLRSSRAAMRAQPVVGATVGTLFYLLLTSGALGIEMTKADPTSTGTLSWPLLAIYCFLAGYSEPFFLRVVQRVAGAAEKRGETKTTVEAGDEAGKARAGDSQGWRAGESRST